MRTKNKDVVIGILIMVLFSLFVLYDFFNHIQHNLIGYDDAYNATVAANYAKYGVYRVSYPAEIVFYNLITTGETVLLPTAMLYSLFGISNITTSIVPILYSLLCIWFVWILVNVCLRQICNYSYCISAFVVPAIILSDGLYYYISTHLIGEIASLFFILLSFLFLNLNLGRTEKDYYLTLSGAFALASFLTKSSMIFAVASYSGLLFIETIVSKRISLHGFIHYIIGMFLGFMIIESFKIYQLNGWQDYIRWWQDEWSNMITQSGGLDISYSLLDKISYLSEIFSGCNSVFCILMLVFPEVMYVYFLYKSMKIERTTSERQALNGPLTMSIAGVCGCSLIVYFILFGGGGLFYPRRHAVYEVLVRLCVIYFVCIFLVLALSQVKNITRYSLFETIGAILVLILAIPFSVLNRNIISYIDKDEDSYSLEQMNIFIQEIDSLPDDAALFVAGWWQEPVITLYLDKEMYDIYEVLNNKKVFPRDSYFISGALIDGVSLSNLQEQSNSDFVRVDTSEVDYEEYDSERDDSGFDREDIESFAIYRIEPHSNLGLAPLTPT